MWAMTRAVTIRAVTNIIPTKLSNHEGSTWVLSSLDHSFCTSYNYPKFIFYFKSASTDLSGEDYVEGLMRSLKESLASVLDVYPVVAGRVRSNDQGRLQIVRVAKDGVQFVEAIADARLDDWPDLRLCSLTLELNPHEDFLKGIEEVSLAKVQVTVFKCGGVAIGFSIAHILADGSSTLQFLRAWGEMHQRKSLSITPLLSRTIIRARDPAKVHSIVSSSKSHEAADQKQRTSASVLCQPKAHDLGSDSDQPLSHYDIYQPHLLFMRLSDKKVSECVREVETGPFAYGRATSHEALCAVLWSSLARARGWSSEQSEESRFYFPMSIRNRCDPPIPIAYFGNVALMCYVADKAVSVASNHISYAAKLIHESIQRFDAEFIQSEIDWLDQQAPNYISTPPLQFGDPNDIGGTTLVMFPIYDVDFGWGKPSYVNFGLIRPEFDPGPRSGILIMPTAEGGRSREVFIGCPNQKEMDVVLNNPVLLSYRDKENDILLPPHT